MTEPERSIIDRTRTFSLTLAKRANPITNVAPTANHSIHTWQPARTGQRHAKSERVRSCRGKAALPHQRCKAVTAAKGRVTPPQSPNPRQRDRP